MNLVARLSAVAALGLAAGAAHAVTITDVTVYSTNASGQYYPGWIWNTQVAPADGPNRYNLYFSTEASPSAPGDFLNAGDGTAAEVSIDLAPGVYDFNIFGEQPNGVGDFPDVHYVANLYFGGNQTAAGISGQIGPSCAGLCPASSPAGTDIFGDVAEAQAGTLSYTEGDTTVALTGFSRAPDDGTNVVWEQFAGDYFGSFSPRPDFVGTMQLTVSGDDIAPIPLPASGLLLLGALGAAGAGLRRRG